MKVSNPETFGISSWRSIILGYYAANKLSDSSIRGYEMRNSLGMRNGIPTVLSLVLINLFAVQLSVNAEQVCKITDPTDTSLNVRDRPNGEIINVLRNGREVYIHETAYDEQNRPWVKVGGYYEGEYRIWGWVLREFISCYNR
jgi:hypothetical protein